MVGSKREKKKIEEIMEDKERSKGREKFREKGERDN